MSKTMLPKEWINTNLGAILLSIIGGGTPSKSKPEYFLGNIPWMSVKDMNKHILKDTIDHITPDAVKNSSTNIIPAGTPIIATRMSLGKIVTASFDSAINQDLKALFLPKDIERNFFLHWYRSQSQLIESLGTGTTVKGIRLEVLNGLSINLPPLAEQKIIADKLDDLLARVDSIKARLGNIPELLKKFRHSVLLSAVSGKLTAEWRNENKTSESAKELVVRWISLRKERFSIYQNELLALGDLKRTKKFIEPHLPDIETGGELVVPPSWEIVSVSQIADCLDSQRIPVKKEKRIKSEGLYPYFGANGEVDRVDDFIFNGDYVLVTEDETFYGRVKPIAYRYTGKCWVNNHVHILSAPTKSANDYLCYALMYYKIIPWLTGTTGRAKLTQAALNVLPIGLPPEKEIEEIVLRIDQFFSYADSIQRAANNALARINNLTQSILAKAFCGELTAQWREENLDLISGINSAEALLQKISTEKLASGTSKKIVKKVVR
ncbi:TPA: restriction endonuclease subunit S [Klebsiella michiganensis]|uniref:restriction endonuclease subunit S n=1 Tax=Enterobacteriaceae TaxID=543 RepID=UPI0007CC3F05|nr:MULTISPECIES: restriction endonuclease subunit S [Enterobacteriaceae]ARB23547.1 type I restriction endonuclease subunit S [Klebsiella oxytoca]ELW9392998.1 restriction endonuclease subunit S [Klebsiella pneumoniae]MBZ7270862.1 type I restriction endonuclease subunit S [Klebsiella michiganensis]MCB3568752.1 restriction endonuclease subunit S [Klebsiella michiganensis]MCD6624659.1 restriction endonuclease subunit S [Klebsiella michiganensis]